MWLPVKIKLVKMVMKIIGINQPMPGVGQDTGKAAGSLPIGPLPLDWKMPAELSRILSLSGFTPWNPVANLKRFIKLTGCLGGIAMHFRTWKSLDLQDKIGHD